MTDNFPRLCYDLRPLVEVFFCCEPLLALFPAFSFSGFSLSSFAGSRLSLLAPGLQWFIGDCFGVCCVSNFRLWQYPQFFKEIDLPSQLK